MSISFFLAYNIFIAVNILKSGFGLFTNEEKVNSIESIYQHWSASTMWFAGIYICCVFFFSYAAGDKSALCKNLHFIEEPSWSVWVIRYPTQWWGGLMWILAICFYEKFHPNGVIILCDWKSSEKKQTHKSRSVAWCLFSAFRQYFFLFFTNISQ